MNDKITEYKFKEMAFCLLIMVLVSGALLGAILNLNVMILNGGKMPVKNGFADRTHSVFTEDSQIVYPLLADRFHIGNSKYSIGDLIELIALVGIIVCIGVLLHLNKKIRNLKKNLEVPEDMLESEDEDEDEGNSDTELEELDFDDDSDIDLSENQDEEIHTEEEIEAEKQAKELETGVGVENE